MKCNRCGRIIEDYELICPHCGFFHDPELEEKNQEHIRKYPKASETVIYERDDFHVKGKRGVFAIISFFKNAFNFLGVADRAEYFTQLFFIYIFVFIFIYIDKQSNLFNPITGFNSFLYTFSILVILLCLIPLISATVRRLHDGGYSGLWFFILFVPIIGEVVILFLTLMPYQRNQYNDMLENKNKNESVGNQINFHI